MRVRSLTVLKDVLLFLFLVFGLGYGLMLVAFARQQAEAPGGPAVTFSLLGLLFLLPSAAAFFARRASRTKGITSPRLWPISWWKVLRIAAGVPLVFVVSYALQAALGLVEPQWRMGTLIQDLYATGAVPEPMPEQALKILPAFSVTAFTVLSITLGATVLTLFALGTEWAWRGYLLPRLLPLGIARAHLITGVLWGLWWLPLVWIVHKNTGSTESLPFLALKFMLFAIAFGAVLGEIWRRTGEILLVAVALGVFLGQLLSFWGYLFPVEWAPWTGPFGLVSTTVWLAVARWSWLLVGTESAPARASGLFVSADTPAGVAGTSVKG